jgi:hypothetical protein
MIPSNFLSSGPSKPSAAIASEKNEEIKRDVHNFEKKLMNKKRESVENIIKKKAFEFEEEEEVTDEELGFGVEPEEIFVEPEKEIKEIINSHEKMLLKNPEQQQQNNIPDLNNLYE